MSQPRSSGDEQREARARVVSAKPADAQAHHALAEADARLGRLDDCIVSCRKAVALAPDRSDSWLLLGKTLAALGRTEEAVTALREVVLGWPDSAVARSLLSGELHRLGRDDLAAEQARHALAIEPADAEAHLHLGLALQGLGREPAATEALGRAAALRPEDPAYQSLLGQALMREGRFGEAFAAIRLALLLDPSDAGLHCVLARAMRGCGRLDDALAAYDQAIRLRPALAHAHYGRATILLALGRFREAWEDFEWRRELPEAAATRRRHSGYAAPRWRGEPFQGRTLLVGIEQGAGDIFQFVRFLGQVKARGGRVLLECRSEHRQLFRRLAGADELVARGAKGVAFDLFVPLLTLPGLLGTVPETIPSEVPYLFADPCLVARWRDVLPSGPETRVGLVWGGNPRHAGDRQRSAPLAVFQPLAAMPGIRLFSLQQGGREAELATAAPALRLENLGARIQGYAETAAIIANLDLVVSVDTSVAHLAAAMGKPVWVLLAVDADWRWGRESDRSPWYPTMRLFRQSRPGSWGKVIEQVARALHAAA